jgi:glycosyltransferase involved in cell wall biosynthesis
MNNRNPLISCICITKDKPDLLMRAITCFEGQTYSNKELIVLYESNDTLTDSFFKKNTFNPMIKVVVVESLPKKKLGELRNLAIRIATGEYICQWDDDDWYHARRLENQYDFIRSSDFKGSILNQWIVYDCESKNAYLSNCRLWEGSILCKKDILMLKEYDNLSLGEDTPVITYLSAHNYLKTMEGHAHLYIYVRHGKNTWGTEYWKTLFEWSTKLSSEESLTITKIVNQEFPLRTASSLLDEIFLSKFEGTDRLQND